MAVSMIVSHRFEMEVGYDKILDLVVRFHAQATDSAHSLLLDLLSTFLSPIGTVENTHDFEIDLILAWLHAFRRHYPACVEALIGDCQLILYGDEREVVISPLVHRVGDMGP
jgi:hypothetical protein